MYNNQPQRPKITKQLEDIFYKVLMNILRNIQSDALFY